MAGGVYAMVSMGLTLIFGVMRIINFAHGDFLMLGMYAAVGLGVGFGLDPYISILIIVPGVLHARDGRLLHRDPPLIRRGAPHTTQALATLGLSVVIVSGILLVASGRSMIVTTRFTTLVMHVGPLVLSVTRADRLCRSRRGNGAALRIPEPHLSREWRSVRPHRIEKRQRCWAFPPIVRTR